MKTIGELLDELENAACKHGTSLFQHSQSKMTGWIMPFNRTYI